MSRTPVIFGNWKMNMLQKDAEAFLQEVDPYLTGSENAVFGICAPYTDLGVCVQHARHLQIGAENCSQYDHGAYTAEISIPMLTEIGVKYCIIGHSERRTYYSETSAACAEKAKALFAAGIVPILCVGETEAQYDAGQTQTVLKQELQESLQGLTAEQVAQMIIAYEPIWAIGTGKSADPGIAQSCCQLVRQTVQELFTPAAAEAVRIQYGGSVKPANIKEYMACADIDGALIGGASLKADSFKAIIDAVR